ncbi:phage major capsid protein [Macrococcus sp. PK]|uniref:phage major capsid protein n=1 Tax=Macrococcus sp. PK TaxID=2801919 RepID=UPI001F10F5E6|nr:phage major capsid protein [Macrococcus sp. PK]
MKKIKKIGGKEMKLKDLQALRAKALDEATEAVDNGDMDLYKAKYEEAEGYLEQINALNDLEKAKTVNTIADFNVMPAEPVTPEAKNELKAFVNFMRTGDVSNAMVEKVDEDGGLIVPEDISMKINEFKRNFESLEKLVNVEPVRRPKGSRLYEKLGTMTPFVAVDEMGEIPEIDGPKFERIVYSITNYAGILPMSNDLIQDSDENIIAYAARWGARKSVITRNKLILDAIKTLTAVPMATVNDFKMAMNVTLDPMFLSSTKIITNQDGLQWLDTLTDKNGAYLMQPLITDPTKKQIAGKEVVVIGNAFLPSENGKAPMIIGDLKEAVTLFDRQKQSILTTNVGGKAFTRNSTDMRFIEREDVQLVDKAAVVYGQIDVSSVTAPAGV